MSSTAATTSKKTSGAKKAAAPAPAAAAPAAAAVAPVPAPIAAPATVVPAANTVTNAAAAPTAETEDVNIVVQFNALVEQVNTARTALTNIFSSMKKLEKQIPRELKKAGKGRRGRKAETTTATGEPIVKKPSVFTIPTQISDALAQFLGVPKGTQISRSEVTTRVCKYAKEHNLMDKQNIKPDAPLRKLLGVKETDLLRILNLQKYLSVHYPLSVKAKADKAAAAAAAAAPVAARS
jgi:chromatin remodeling complex protein RSC6